MEILSRSMMPAERTPRTFRECAKTSQFPVPMRPFTTTSKKPVGVSIHTQPKPSCRDSLDLSTSDTFYTDLGDLTLLIYNSGTEFPIPQYSNNPCVWWFAGPNSSQRSQNICPGLHWVLRIVNGGGGGGCVLWTSTLNRC